MKFGLHLIMQLQCENKYLMRGSIFCSLSFGRMYFGSVLLKPVEVWISVPGVIFFFFFFSVPTCLCMTSFIWVVLERSVLPKRGKLRSKQHIRVTDLHIVVRKFSACFCWLGFCLGEGEILSGFPSPSSWENPFKKRYR